MAEEWTSRRRLITALDNGTPDRLPVTTHHLMSYFLDTYMGGISNEAFFREMGMDPICWLSPYNTDSHLFPERLERRGPRSVFSIRPDWVLEWEDIPSTSYPSTRYWIRTPGRTLSCVVQRNHQTSWCIEHLIKEKGDLDTIARYAPPIECADAAFDEAYQAYGDTALIRGTIPGFEVFGQPGCWQDACCLVGTEKLILEAFDDPSWVHSLCATLQKRKLAFVESVGNKPFDLFELGGGDASTTVISPGMFEDFVAPYDSPVIAALRQNGQRAVYHTCGGMMPILEMIADMGPNAIETLTPVGMGGDVDLAETKRRVGHRVAMIGGFDQGRYFWGCGERETREAVSRAFEEAGEGGGFILSPSDHFFDAEPDLIRAFADEARRCLY